ncbi:MAG: DUF2058 family protein [Wenzhouxiangellaceae bacterium]|nr:DUF2058 family protein [Wenzhouxiangellaceae bacterium]
MGSLQDALLKTGLSSKEQARRHKAPAGGNSRGGQKRPSTAAGGDGAPVKGRAGKGGQKKPHQPPRKQPEHAKKPPPTDLERAYAARQKAEKDEKERVKQARVADQEERRQRNLKLDGIVAGRGLNDEAAEIPRYFEHLGRIRRVLCRPEQRDAINAGTLGIVNLRGRYLIVEPEVLEQYRAVAPDLVPDLSGTEPSSGDGADDGAEYPPIPDDLTW